jgi:hypothetical protein
MHLPVRPFPWPMPYGRTTNEQSSYGCSGYGSGEDNPCDHRSHYQDQVEPVGPGASSIRANPNIGKL